MPARIERRGVQRDKNKVSWELAFTLSGCLPSATYMRPNNFFPLHVCLFLCLSVFFSLSSLSFYISTISLSLLTLKSVLLTFTSAAHSLATLHYTRLCYTLLACLDSQMVTMLAFVLSGCGFESRFFENFSFPLSFFPTLSPFPFFHIFFDIGQI